MAKFTDDIAIKINNNKCTLATFIDFRKAFDTVNHKILIEKANSLGIKNNTLRWKQVVNANGVTSKEGIVTCGVPQGSTLAQTYNIVFM